jgi:hypothetical protein
MKKKQNIREIMKTLEDAIPNDLKSDYMEFMVQGGKISPNLLSWIITNRPDIYEIIFEAAVKHLGIPITDDFEHIFNILELKKLDTFDLKVEMILDIGTYRLKEDKNQKCIVYAVYKSIFIPDCNSVLARRINDFTDFTNIFKKDHNFGNDKSFYKYMFEYLTFNKDNRHYCIKPDDSDTIFDSETFINLYEEISVVPDNKKINIGKMYISRKSNDIVYVLGVVRTDLNEDDHTVFFRYNSEKDFNKYIDYDHDQFGSTPDYRNCFFTKRKTFLEQYKII